MERGVIDRSTIFLTTEKFSEEAINRIRVVLKENYGIECSVYKTNTSSRLYMLEGGVQVLKEIISPYIIPSMRYKLTGIHEVPVTRPIATKEEEARLIKLKSQFNNLKLLGLTGVQTPEHWQEFINGLFMAEGHVGAHFQGDKTLGLMYILEIGQNYSVEAGNLFLTTREYLGGAGKFALLLMKGEKEYISYEITKRQEVLGSLAYFKYLYGSKK